MKYEIGTEAIVIEAGSHDFKIGERIVLDEIYNNEIMKFTNLDNSDYWFMDHSEVEFLKSQFNLADYLPFPKEGLNVILKNGSNAKLYHDLSETDYVGQYPILGVDTGQIIQFSLSGKVHPHHSPLDIAQIGCSDCTEFPEDMWSVVSTDFNYLSIDEDGDSWFFEEMPWIMSDYNEGYGSWTIDDGKYEQNFIIPVSTSNWKMSLIKRPDNQK